MEDLVAKHSSSELSFAAAKCLYDKGKSSTSAIVSDVENAASPIVLEITNFR